MIITILAYLLILFGVPIALSSLFSLLIDGFIELLGGRVTHTITNDLYEGFISFFIATYIFILLKVPLSIFYPIILCVITYLGYSTRGETKESIANIIGIIIGFITYNYVF